MSFILEFLKKPINFQLINRNIVCVWLDLIVRSDFWEEDVCVHIYNMIFLQLSSGWHSIGTKTSKYKESNYEHSCNITIQFSKWFLRKGFFMYTYFPEGSMFNKVPWWQLSYILIDTNITRFEEVYNYIICALQYKLNWYSTSVVSNLFI